MRSSVEAQSTARALVRRVRATLFPTKDEHLCTLPLCRIKGYVDEFIAFAIRHPQHEFQVTPIGCGLAGYKPKDIAPMFSDAPANVFLPPEFR